MSKERETWHEVQEDEDLPIIAAMYGIKDWQWIYDHAENADLREQRPNPHILYQRDRVWIPEVEPEPFEVTTNQKHSFVLYPPKTVFQLFLQDDDGTPFGDLKYELWINGERYGEGEQKTREDGLIFAMIPVVKEVELRVWFPIPKEAPEDDDEIEEGNPAEEDLDYDPWWDDDEAPLPEDELEVDPEVYETFIVKLAHLDPIDTTEGIQDRLNNLGYDCGDEHGEIGPITEEALREFQEAYGLPVTGTIDPSEDAEDPTLAKLAELFDEDDQDDENG